MQQAFYILQKPMFFITGTMCDDPGTYGDTRQVADSYAIGAVIYYECTKAKPGFQISGPQNYTCLYDEMSGMVNWSNNLESDLPMCKGRR